MQLKALAVHGAEVLLFQEVTQTKEAIGVATRGVHGPDEGLQTDVAHQFIVHIVLVFVQVAFDAFVLLAALLTDACPRQASTAAPGFGLCCSHWPTELTSSCVVCFGIFHERPQSPGAISYFILGFFAEERDARDARWDYSFSDRPAPQEMTNPQGSSKMATSHSCFLSASFLRDKRNSPLSQKSPRSAQKWLSSLKWSTAHTRVNPQLITENKGRAQDENKNFE